VEKPSGGSEGAVGLKKSGRRGGRGVRREEGKERREEGEGATEWGGK